MQWVDVINAPYLKNLPFKIELNKLGQILMSPASNQHGKRQFEIGSLVQKNRQQQGHEGSIIMECSIDTPSGVKVADVAWASADFLAQYGELTPFPKAPELCVEILSPSNTTAEMQEKVQLYLAKGAKEVWLADTAGSINYYSHEGELPHSRFLV